MDKLISSLKPKKTKSFASLNYYDPVYIENRVDIDCKKTLTFIKSKILYNFLYDFDMNNFLLNCKDVSKLRDSCFDCNQTDLRGNITKTELFSNLNEKYLIYFGATFLVFSIFCCRCFFFC